MTIKVSASYMALNCHYTDIMIIKTPAKRNPKQIGK